MFSYLYGDHLSGLCSAKSEAAHGWTYHSLEFSLPGCLVTSLSDGLKKNYFVNTQLFLIIRMETPFS